MIQRTHTLAVWLIALSAVASARFAPASDVSSVGSSSASSYTASGSSGNTSPAKRQLLQNAFCPDGCSSDADSCVWDSTVGGLRCQKCKNNLRVNLVTGMCSCRAGTYSDADNPDFCIDCPRDHYCPGGAYTYASPPDKLQCPPNMVTLTMRSGTIRACVNLPGWYYSFDVNMTPFVAPCPVDTYCVGSRKQRQCTPCPTGFSTAGLMMQKSVSSCVVPEGYFLKGPGQVAPCPKGEWKEGIGPAGNCTKCAFGVTTFKEASTSPNDCAYVVPSYYASAFDAATGQVTQAKLCPQGYICPGGKPSQAFNALNPAGLSPSEPTITKCPDGLWTVEPGAIIDTQCLTPPGHYTDGGVTAQCPAGSYRADWKPAGQATSCTPCGDNVFADKTDVVVVYDVSNYVTTNKQITSGADDCYIKAGQGLFFSSLTRTWRARNCDDNSYGVSNKTYPYGLSTYTCRACPKDMVASNDTTNYPNSASYYRNNGDGTGGFVDVRACVTQDGYGVSARGAQQCDQGKYNRKDNYNSCSSCQFGTTTAGVGKGFTLADCSIAQGYGFHNGAIALCPIGTFNDKIYSPSTTQPCTECPLGSTTSALGGDASNSCNMCSAGYGGSTCRTRCGGPGNATYGPPGREYGSDCVECAVADTGFSFSWASSNDIYAPGTVAPIGADAPQDCLAEFGQLMDGAWYLPTTGNTGMTTHSNVWSFPDCVNLCSSSTCQFVTYNYNTRTCFVRSASANVLSGSPLIGFKGIPSGDIGVSSLSNPTRGQATTSGHYSFYQEPNALDVGTQTAPAGASGFTTLQQCLNACDNDGSCAGITITMAVDVSLRPKSCKLIRGDTTPGTFIRTMTRMDAARLAIPSLS